jgi:Zn-dependent M32 family carboxypeptidase
MQILMIMFYMKVKIDDPETEIHGDDVEPINDWMKDEVDRREDLKPQKESLGESLLAKVEKNYLQKLQKLRRKNNGLNLMI